MSVRGMSAAVGLAMTLAVGAWGQAAPQDAKQDPPPPCLNATAQNCVPAKTAPAKSAADENPFPGESSAPPTRPADWGPDQPLPPDPNAPPAAPAPARKPGEAQPFPGEPGAPAQAQKPAEPAPASDDGFSSSSSSSSSADAPPDDDSGLADKGSSGDATAKVPINRRKKLPKVTPETPQSRAAEDLTVADFYRNDGNFKGAYDRAKDAVQYQPNDPYGHFALAEAARKLGKLDEARTEYQAVLKLDPIPKQEKASKRALAEMEGK
ncbi:MAG TPA: tetratricopeptide repeat protein [Acidobacteriaceae bacterium]|nr:tetratricopeptide repeat protein [Acidobacteriaceae bacterium]